MPERLGDVGRVDREIEQLFGREAGIGQIDALDRGVEGVLEEADQWDVAHGADVVVWARGVGREVDVRGIERGVIGPGSNDGLVEDAVLDGGVERLDAPVQRAFRRGRHDVTAYGTRWVVVAAKNNTTECQDGIRDALEQRLLRIRSREVWVFETRNHEGIVAPKGLIPRQCHDAHISRFPVITRLCLGRCVVIRDLLVRSLYVHFAGKGVGAIDPASRLGGGNVCALFGDLCRNIVTDTTKAKGV